MGSAGFLCLMLYNDHTDILSKIKSKKLPKPKAYQGNQVSSGVASPSNINPGQHPKQMPVI